MSDLQREFLHLYNKSGHVNFSKLQNLARKGLIPAKFKNVTPPVCITCVLGKQHKLARTKDNKIAGSSVKQPGDMIHMDQCIVTTPGCPMTHSGKNNPEKITCFTIYVDSISHRIHIHFQSSTEAVQTLVGKHRLERYGKKFQVKIKSFRADNGIFKAKKFMDDIDACDQDITFCGVNAHHQNGVAERHIRTIVEKGRTNFIHAATKWPHALDTELWSYAINYSVYQWNNTPRDDLDLLTPEEKFQGIDPDCVSSKYTNNFTRNLHPFGCPVYILDEQLQKGQTIPKFDHRSQVEIFVRHSSHHSSKVALIYNMSTKHISPQYHVLFDDNFDTIPCKSSTDAWKMWDALAEPSRLNPKDAIDMKFPSFETVPKTVDSEESVISTSDVQRESPSISSSEGENSSPLPLMESEAPPAHNNIDLRTLISNVRFKPQKRRKLQPKQSVKEPQTLPRHKVHAKAKRTYNKKQYIPNPSRPTQATGQRVSKRAKKQSARAQAASQENAIKAMLSTYDNLNKQDPMLHTLPLNEQIDCMLDLTATDDGEINDIHPWALAASANPNILSHSQAKRADDWEEFVKAMKEEVDRMLKNNIFKLVKRSVVPLNQRILRSVWSHRRKTTPSGEVYRYRSRLCVDGSQQQHGIDYNETYSPVVQWTTVRLLMIFAKIFGLHMRQVDYVQAFPQAYLPEGENVFMEIPGGYDLGDKPKGDYCLQLIKNCYGLKQAAFNWNNLLKSGLLSLGFKQSEHDQCLYIKDDVICVIYVDDTLFFSKDPSKVDKVISNLQKLNFELTDEGDVDAFLGIKVEQQQDGTITMTQPDLVNRVITALGLDNQSKQHKVPAISPPLHAHKHGAEREKHGIIVR